MIISLILHIIRVSDYSENKLFENDNKLKELEVMVSLFESKLQSLPSEITSQFPELTQEKLGDFSKLISVNTSNTMNFTNTNANNNNVMNNNPSQENINSSNTDKNDNNNLQAANNIIENNKTEETEDKENTIQQNIETKIEEVVVEKTPQEKVDDFLKENPNLERVYKAMQRKIPSFNLIPQSRLLGIKEEVIKELIELYQKVDPSYF